MDEQDQFENEDSCHSSENAHSCDKEALDHDDVNDGELVGESVDFPQTKLVSDVVEDGADELSGDSQEIIDTSLKETTNIPKEISRGVGSKCSAIGCDHQKSVNLCSLISFPQDEDLKQRWVLSMQRCFVDDDGKVHRNKLWEPRAQHRLCSCHFSQPVNATGNPEGNSDLTPDTFHFPEEGTGRKRQKTKFRLKLNDAVITKREDDDSMTFVAIQNMESTEEECTTGLGNTTSLKTANICSALGCDHSQEDTDCTLLKFPMDIEWRRRWVTAMERCYVSETGVPDHARLWEPNGHHKLCTCHFSFPVEVKKKDPELRHIVPDLFSFPDEQEEGRASDKWSKCRLRITGTEDFHFPAKYTDMYEERNKKEKERKAEKDKVSQTFTKIIGSPMEGNDKKDQLSKVPVDKNMNICSALTCTHKIYDKACSFFSFPKDPVWKERWVIALQRCYVSKEGVPDPNRLWQPTEQHKLCACHFSVAINTRTRRRGYNHIIPDLVEFPSAEDQEVEVWMKHRLTVTEQHTAKLKLAPDELLHTAVEDVTFTEKSATSMHESFSYDTLQPQTDPEEATCDANTSDSNHLYGLLTKPKLEQVNISPYQDPMSGSLSASQISLKFPLFVKYHTNGKDNMAVEADTKEKQFHSHCAAVGCLHRVSQKICSFLSFPKAPEWRQNWAFALRRCYVDEQAQPDLQRLWEPRDHHRLCTCHFSFPINAKTRKSGYNHVLPDVLSFPDDDNNSKNPVVKDEKIKNTANVVHTNGQVPIKIEPGSFMEMENSFSLSQTSGVSFSQASEAHQQTENSQTHADSDWNTKATGSGGGDSSHTGDTVEENRGLQRDDFGHSVCSAPGCHHRKGENYCSFVSFPKYPELRQKWVTSIQRYEVEGNGEKKPWEPGEQHKLCVCHFSTPINVRSRAPEVKLIVPDILDTSSFIPVPTSKVSAGNKQTFTMKRVDANLITKEDVARWYPHEMEMFLTKNKRKKDFKSRQQLLANVWSYILQKRNNSTQAAYQTEHGPPTKKQKVSESSSWQKSVSHNRKRTGSPSWVDATNVRPLPAGENFLSSIMHKVITDYHSNSPGESNRQEVDVQPSVPLPVGFIDMNSQNSFQLDNSSKLQNHSSPATTSSNSLKNLLTPSNVKAERHSNRTPAGQNNKIGNEKRLPTTKTNNKLSLLKSALTDQEDHMVHSGNCSITPQSHTFQNLAVESERLDALEEELMDGFEADLSHKEKLDRLKAELAELKTSHSDSRRTASEHYGLIDIESPGTRKSRGNKGCPRKPIQTENHRNSRHNSALLSTQKEDLVRNSELSTMVIQQVKMYVCEFCDMEFKKKAPLFAHKMKWHRDQNVCENWEMLERVESSSAAPPVEEDLPSQNENVELLMCRECGDEYDSRKELEEHMRTHDE